MKDVKIQDNFLEQNYFDKLIEEVDGPFCPYFIQDHVKLPKRWSFSNDTYNLQRLATPK